MAAKPKPVLTDAQFGELVRSCLKRLDDIDDQLEAVRTARKELYAEAKARGLKKRYLVEVHALMKLDPEKRDLSDRELARYRKAAGIEVLTDLLGEPSEAA